MAGGFRTNIIFIFFFVFSITVGARLFYWQVISGTKLTKEAENQHWASYEIPAKRGKILASDGFPLVSNEQAYLVFASPLDIKIPPKTAAKLLAPFIVPDGLIDTDFQKKTEDMILERLSRADLNWIPLKHKVPDDIKDKIEALKLDGIGFEDEARRSYPEGSSSSQLLGFVGADYYGQDMGYFGLEGYYNLELKGRSGILRREKDASGRPILVGLSEGEAPKDGRDLVTTIDRSVQYIIDKKLKKGVWQYGAVSGLVVVLNPKTGAVLGIASQPSYDSANYMYYDKSSYPNPAIAMSYEPGSTFKVLIMAAAINEHLVNADTVCDQCSGPRTISDYTIKTWNDKYYPQSTMTQVIQHSDNVGMVFVSDKLGKEMLVSYIQKFGFGKPTGVDLQEESSPLLRADNDWKQIDLATASFGQGIAVTPLQMVRAVSTIANGGKLMKPYVVKKVLGPEGTTEILPKAQTNVISPATAAVITEIMVNAVDMGESKWAKPKGYRIAGKTGTAQIPVAGHYDNEKTIASFVGFAPADDPQFAMLVILREPATSQWGSETAAPLWFDISKDLFDYYGISPSE